MAEQARLAALRPGDMSAQQRQLYDELTTGARGSATGGIEVAADGRLAGPFNAMLHHPRIGDPLQRLGAALRYSGVLSARCRELAILLVAAHHRSGYEWYAHAAIAQRAGVATDQVEAIRTGGEPELHDEAERVTVATVRELLSAGDLADASYGSAVAVLGVAAVVELTSLVGYYGLLAVQLRVFRVSPPRGVSAFDGRD